MNNYDIAIIKGLKKVGALDIVTDVIPCMHAIKQGDQDGNTSAYTFGIVGIERAILSRYGAKAMQDFRKSIFYSVDCFDYSTAYLDERIIDLKSDMANYGQLFSKALEDFNRAILTEDTDSAREAKARIDREVKRIATAILTINMITPEPLIDTINWIKETEDRVPALAIVGAQKYLEVN